MLSVSNATALRTAWPGSTAARATARTLSRTCLTSRGIDSFAAGQLSTHVPIRREEAVEVALHHVGGDQTVASDAHARRNARTFADDRNPGLQIARLRAIRPDILAFAQAHIGADHDVLIEDDAIEHAAGADNAVRKQDALTDHGALGHEHARREHRVLDGAVD